MPHAERCANPMQISMPKGHLRKNLRVVSEALRQQFPFLSKDDHICTTCRNKAVTYTAPSPVFNGVSHEEGSSPKLSNSAAPEDSHPSCSSNKTAFIADVSDNNLMETSLRSGNSFHSNNAPDNEALNDDADESMEIDNSSTEDDSDTDSESQSRDPPKILPSQREIELEEMLRGIKDKFKCTKNYSERLQILTIAPPSWSIRQLSREFETTRYMAQKAKQLRGARGVLAATVAKAGRSLPDETVQAVRNFYEDNSRMMPGVKDKISVRINDEKKVMQKRMVLEDVVELHRQFKIAHPECPVGFSKFAELRPKHCVLAGAPGTHVVCVCTYHQNCILMLDAIDIATLTQNSSFPLATYKDCLSKLMCPNPTPLCYLDECKTCPGVHPLSQDLKDMLQKAMIETVEFRTWESVDRATLLTQKMPMQEFIDLLCVRLKSLKSHHFIATEQTAYMKERKESLTDGEVLVQCDFSENYNFIAQDAAQSFHYNNDHCTVHPAVYYYRYNNEIRHRSLVLLSESLLHDTAAVYLMQTVLIEHIREVCDVITKVIYVTDGAAQHYKNRYQIANLLSHREDFGIDAEAHYHATAHGKTACDGVGAVLKREARRRSLQIVRGEPILTPDALYQWAKGHFKDLDVFYYTKQDHEDTQKRLKQRFDSAKAIPSIQKNHCFIPGPERELWIKRYSAASTAVVFPKKRQYKRHIV